MKEVPETRGTLFRSMILYSCQVVYVLVVFSGVLTFKTSSNLGYFRSGVVPFECGMIWVLLHTRRVFGTVKVQLVNSL